MSIWKVCAVWDSAVQAFMRPMYVPHTGAAVRSFRDEVNRTSDPGPLAAHPEDFELHLVGEWDDETGVTVAIGDGGPDVVLIRGKDAKSLV